MKNSKLKCAVYTRVSTDNQAEVEFNSCEAQETKISSFIQSQENMELLRAYSDPGFSGASLNRPALNEMLADIQRGKINLVIAYKIDRLTRSPKDFYQLIELFDKYGVDFISVTERFDTSTPSGRLLRNIMLTFAQFERELASERTKDKLLERASKGMWNGGVVPFGYKTVDKRLVPDEQKFQRLRKIFGIFAETGSLAKTYQLLKNQQIFNRKGSSFSKPHLQSILSNIIYTGKMKYAGKIYQGRHQPLISDELYNRVQALHRERVRKMRLYKDYVLGGLVRCDECDSFMTPCHTNKKMHGRTRHYYYYRCTKTFKREWNSCTTRQVSADRLEDYVFENLERISNDKHYIDSLIFKLNNDAPGDRKGLELNRECPEISPEIFASNLKIFADGLLKRKGADRNLWTQKFIKRILYSKEEIVITLYYKRDFEKETAVWTASGRAAAAAGHSLGLAKDKKISPIPRDRRRNKEWLPGKDSSLRPGGYNLPHTEKMAWRRVGGGLSFYFAGARFTLPLSHTASGRPVFLWHLTTSCTACFRASIALSCNDSLLSMAPLPDPDITDKNISNFCERHR